jgi:hypothetical protein
MPQTMGFGKLATYHALNEYALLSDFAAGFSLLATLIDDLESGGSGGNA